MANDNFFERIRDKTAIRIQALMPGVDRAFGVGQRPYDHHKLSRQEKVAYWQSLPPQEQQAKWSAFTPEEQDEFTREIAPALGGGNADQPY